MIKWLNDEREKENKAFKAQLEEHEQVRLMIEEAREIMEGLLNEGEAAGNFLELETDKVQVTYFAF